MPSPKRKWKINECSKGGKLSGSQESDHLRGNLNIGITPNAVIESNSMVEKFIVSYLIWELRISRKHRLKCISKS